MINFIILIVTILLLVLGVKKAYVIYTSDDIIDAKLADLESVNVKYNQVKDLNLKEVKVKKHVIDETLNV